MDVLAPSIHEELEQLINSGNMRVASLKARTYMLQHSDEDFDAHFLAHMHLAMSLEGYAAQDIIKQASLARGFDEVLAADMHIDGVVLPLLRSGRYKEADNELNPLLTIYSGRPNYVAKCIMIKGRIEFAKGNLYASSIQHLEAESIFGLEAYLGRVNETWRQNNVYHRFRTERCLMNVFKPSQYDLVWDLYKKVRQDPARRRSQLFGPLILITGRFGCWVEDSLLRLKNRRFKVA